MPDIADNLWSEVDDRNSDVAPNGFPPGMPAYIDQIGRMMMGAIKRSWGRANPIYETTGADDAYIVSPDSAPNAINLYEIIYARIDRANTTTTPTFQYGMTNPRTIMKIDATGKIAVAAGDLVAGNGHGFWYDGSDWILINPGTIEISEVPGLQAALDSKLAKAYNLSDVADPATALSNIGGVSGPASSTDGNFAVMSGTSGKIIADSGKNAASFATAAQGAKADSALQASDIGTTIQAPTYLPDTDDATLTQTLDDKLRRTLYVEDFRKSGDASWTATAARAIAKAQSLGGGEVKFGDPVQRDMGPTLTINPIDGVGWHNLIVSGVGAAAQLAFDDSLTDQDGFAWVGWGGRCWMRDFSILSASGKGVNWNAGAARGDASYISRFGMENVIVDGCAGDNIDFLQTYMGWFRGVESRNSGGYAFKCNGSHTSMNFDNCWGGGDGANPDGGNAGGWYLNGLVYSSLRDCGADWNDGPGYQIKNSRGLQLIGCGAESNKEEGILVTSSTDDSTSLPFSGVRGLLIKGFGPFNNSKETAGGFANIIGIVTGNSKDCSVSLEGIEDILNNAGDVSIVLNGASGTIDLALEEVYPAGTISKSGSYFIRNKSVMGKVARAGLSGDQSITDSTATTLALAALEDNTLGATLSTNAIVIPAGVNRVKVTVGVYWGSSATGVRLVNIKKGSTVISSAESPSGGISAQCLSSYIVPVSSGDTISVAVTQTSGAALSVIDNGNTFVSVEAMG